MTEVCELKRTKTKLIVKRADVGALRHAALRCFLCVEAAGNVDEALRLELYFGWPALMRALRRVIPVERGGLVSDPEAVRKYCNLVRRYMFTRDGGAEYDAIRRRCKLRRRGAA